MSTLLFDNIKTMSKVTDSVIVGLSTGKDSIVTYDLCTKYFKHVYPYFMYLVPNLEFQERTINWYEKKYGNPIIRLPHFELSSFYRYGTFREPDPYVSLISITDEYEWLRQQTGVEWIAAGERISDSIVRRAMIKHSGSIDQKRGRFYPISEWNKREVLKYVKTYHLFLSPEQKKLGFSFKSLAGAELAVIKQYYTKDYQRILAYFPLASVAVERFEKYGK